MRRLQAAQRRETGIERGLQRRARKSASLAPITEVMREEHAFGDWWFEVAFAVADAAAEGDTEALHRISEQLDEIVEAMPETRPSPAPCSATWRRCTSSLKQLPPRTRDSAVLPSGPGDRAACLGLTPGSPKRAIGVNSKTAEALLPDLTSEPYPPGPSARSEFGDLESPISPRARASARRKTRGGVRS